MPLGGENSRGRGGKFNKAKRGGGKHFSKNLTPLDADGNAISMWADPQDMQKTGLEPNSSSEQSISEGSSEEEEGESQQAQTREERRAAAKARKDAAVAKKQQRAAEPGDLPPSSSEEENDGVPANPKYTAMSKAQAPSSSNTLQPELSRREREALQAQQARERYQKLHAEGKTDEARADLARLKLIREEREAAAARKQAEREEKDAAEERRQADTNEREQKKRDAAMGSVGKKSGKKTTKG